MSSTEIGQSYSRSTNKNPLKLGNNGSERLANPNSSTIYSVSHHHSPLEDDASRSYRAELGNVSYFPDHVARVSYIASVVKPDANGDYLKDLQGGMDLLATRLAPSYFPGTIVQHITTQVDGYFPAACPSKNFSNCQDVTASIGIYLRAIPMAGEESPSYESGSYNSLGQNKESILPVDPSTMTEELLAFQESLSTAIANDELQEAIRQEYRQKGDDIIPAVVIVTDTIDKVGGGANTGIDSDKNFTSVTTDDSIINDNNSIENDDNHAADSNDFFDVSSGDFSSSTTINITLGEPSTSTSSIVSTGGVDDVRNAGLAVGGVIATVLISILLASFFSVARRYGDSRREGAATVRAQKKIKKNYRSRHSNTKNNDDTDAYELSGLKLRGGIHNADSIGDEEEGLLGRTQRTIKSESTVTTSSHEVQDIPTSSGSNSLDNNARIPQITRSSRNNPSQVYESNTLPQTEQTQWKRKTVENLIETVVASSGDLGSTDNEDYNHSSRIHTEVCANAYNGKYDDDDDDENDYVLGDDSDSSVGQHLLSASKSSEFCSVPFGQQNLLQNSNNHNLDSRTSPQLSISSICANDINSQMGKETNVMENTCSSYMGDVSYGPQKSSPAPSSQSPLSIASSTPGSCSVERIEDISPPSELDVAITNCDRATVEAKAAILASTCSSVNQPPVSQRVKLQHSSSSNRISDFSQKEVELDRLVEIGDWQAFVVTADKYDAEGGANDEDAGRSFTSRTSTQGSDANDSCASIMDNSSEGRSTSLGRSVTTSASQKQRILEIRTQVIRLVEEVVPDEEGNVNEMMIQFKGREEDLLETLRTMKERKVARKARIQSQKIARRNTRSRDTTEGLQPPAASDIKNNEGSNVEQIQKNNADVHDKSSSNTSKNMDDDDELSTNENFSRIEKVGSFENATRVNPEEAAAAAAAWAIQRSFDVMMEKEGRVNH